MPQRRSGIGTNMEESKNQVKYFVLSEGKGIEKKENQTDKVRVILKT